MAEEFPRFQLGFEFLNTEKNSSVKESQNEAPVPKKKRFAELTEAERNRLLVETQAKSTKSSTNWAVNAFKGMNLRKRDELQYNTHLKHKLKTCFNSKDRCLPK